MDLKDRQEPGPDEEPQMHEDTRGSHNRRVRIFTPHGHVDGEVWINPRISTLQHMNVTAMSQAFLVVVPPLEPSKGWNLVDGALALAFDSVLFVQELESFDNVDSDRTTAALYERCAVRLSVGEYAVEGFIHVPPGGNPIARLNQDRHEFLALSAVSVVGPRHQFAAPFLAVKRSEVVALQAIGHEVALEDMDPAEASVPC